MYKILFFGAKEEVVSTIVKKYTAVYRNKIMQVIKEDEEDITDSGAHILFVAISSPTKENFFRSS